MGVPLAQVQRQIRGEDSLQALKNKIREDKALALLTAQATFG